MQTDDLAVIAKQVPDDLQKKVRLLKRFKQEIDTATQQMAASMPWYFKQSSQAATGEEMVFVEKFMKFKDRAVMFWFSNG